MVECVVQEPGVLLGYPDGRVVKEHMYGSLPMGRVQLNINVKSFCFALLLEFSYLKSQVLKLYR